MEYKLTAKQGGKTVTLRYEEKSDCEIELTIGRKDFFGTKIVYDSLHDRNRVVRKVGDSDYKFVSNRMRYYRDLNEALGIEIIVGIGNLAPTSYFITGKSFFSKEDVIGSKVEDKGPKEKPSSLVYVVNTPRGEHTAQFLLVGGLLEVVISCLKSLVKPLYDSREDAACPNALFRNEWDNVNYSRLLHYQVKIKELGITIDSKFVVEVYDAFVCKSSNKETPSFLPPVDLWKEGTDKGTLSKTTVMGKKGQYLVRLYLVKGKTHMSIEAGLKTFDHGYHSPLDKKSPPDSTTDMRRFIARMQYFHKKLADFGIDMNYGDLLAHYSTHHTVFDEPDESQSDVYHYEGGCCSNGHWNLDFVSDDDGIVQVIATSVVRFLPDSILYNSIMDPNCPPITNGLPTATANAVRLTYFLRKLAGLQMEMRPMRWQEVFNKFIKGKEPMSNTQEPKVISKRELQLGNINILVELTEDKFSRVRAVNRDENHVINFTKYDSLRDVCAPVQRTNSLLDHLYACFQYYPTKLAEIGASAHVDWWYSVYQDFVGFLHNEVHFHGELKFEEPSFRPRDLMAVLIQVAPRYPRGEIVPDEVRDTLKSLIENRCIRITGIDDKKKYFSPMEISVQGPSLPIIERRGVNFFFNEQDGYPLANFAEALKGVEFDFILIEPDPTQKVVARSWLFANSHISEFVGVPPVRDLMLDLKDRSTEVKFVFNGEQTASPSTMLLANKILSAMNVQSANPHIRKL